MPRYIMFDKRSALLFIAVVMSASGLASCITSVTAVTPIPTIATALVIPTTPSLPTESVFEGRYTSAFEVSVFYPCSMKITEEYVEGFGYKSLGYWLRSVPESGFQKQFQQIRSQVVAATDEGIPTVSVFVRFVGALSTTEDELGKGYGHMGLYTNEITVTNVLEMKTWDDSLCQK